MTMIAGMLEILQMAEGYKPASFSDFTKIQTKKGMLSSATVSKRIDELVSAEAIREVITRSSTGRKVIAYRTTVKGKRVMAHAKKLEEDLQKR